MPSAVDYADFLLQKNGPMSGYKLQKLLYYVQCWSLVWRDDVAFKDPIQAWVHGPVIPSVYAHHRGQHIVSQIDGNGETLSGEAKKLTNVIHDFYGQRDSEWLVALTHHEAPWLLARKGLAPEENSKVRLSTKAMKKFYSEFDVAPFALPAELMSGLDVIVNTPSDEIVGLTEYVPFDLEDFTQWATTAE